MLCAHADAQNKMFCFYISETIWFQRLYIELTANIKSMDSISRLYLLCVCAMCADAFGATCQNRLYKTLNRFSKIRKAKVSLNRIKWSKKKHRAIGWQVSKYRENWTHTKCRESNLDLAYVTSNEVLMWQRRIFVFGFSHCIQFLIILFGCRSLSWSRWHQNVRCWFRSFCFFRWFLEHFVLCFAKPNRATSSREP